MLASKIHQETLAIAWSEEDSKALELSSHTLGGQACLVDVLFLRRAFMILALCAAVVPA